MDPVRERPAGSYPACDGPLKDDHGALVGDLARENGHVCQIGQ